MGKYFTEDTEKAVLRFVGSDDQVERDKIFKEELFYPLDKMAENIIHTYKGYNFPMSFSDLKHNIVVFYVEQLKRNFNPAKGRAYSYLSYIGRNYIYAGNSSAYKKKLLHEDIQDNEENPKLSYELTQEELNYPKLVKKFTEYCNSNIDIIFPDQRDKSIASAVLNLFQQAENIEVFNKKALYIFVREQTGVETKHITPIVKVLKRQYYKVFSESQDDLDVHDNYFQN